MGWRSDAATSVADGNAHVAGGAFDDPHGGLNAGAVEVGELPDLNCTSVESAMRIIEGTARNMGVSVSD